MNKRGNPPFKSMAAAAEWCREAGAGPCNVYTCPNFGYAVCTIFKRYWDGAKLHERQPDLGGM